jgi:hypothetical protein
MQTDQELQNKNLTKEEKTLAFVKKKKDTFKSWKYRQTFDALYKNAKENLIDTTIKFDKVSFSDNDFQQIPIMKADGTTDVLSLPKVRPAGGNLSAGDIPRSKSALGFSKIVTAASAVASTIPDGEVISTSKVKSRIYYSFWKDSWKKPDANGQTTLTSVAMDMFTFGWGAWRIFPKLKVAPVNDGKTKKVLYDGIYREPLDPSRTWIGTSFRPTSNENRIEVYYEIDVTLDEYKKILKSYKKTFNKDKTLAVSIESEQQTQSEDFVTIGFYEDPSSNRFIISTEAKVIYDGELPNRDVYGGVVMTNCFTRNHYDPYGIGLWEVMRGDLEKLSYIESLNDEELEAEVRPLIVATLPEGQLGNQTFQRGANSINIMPASMEITKVQNNGNVTLGMNYVQSIKTKIEENTGVNDSISGANTEGGLGETIIQKEAALNRLLIPRNSLKKAIEFDFCILKSWVEQLYIHGREFEISSSEEEESFVLANKSFHMEEQQKELDEETGEAEQYPKRVVISPYMDTDFDIDEKDGNIEILEFGAVKNSYPRKEMLRMANEYNSNSYSDAYLVVDPTTMLIPSSEIEKQTSLSLLQPIQSSIQLIYGLVRQDPDQAVAQLTAFTAFCKKQKLNVFDYIPKEQYDKLMSASVPVDMQTQMAMDNHQIAMATGMESAEGMPTQMDGTQMTAPQNPMEFRQNQTDMQSAMDGSMNKLNETL